MNQLSKNLSDESVWSHLESQAYEFPRVKDLERRIINSSNLSIEGEDVSKIGGPNFVIFSTTSFPLIFPEFKYSQGGIIAYHTKNKHGFYVLSQNSKPLHVTHISRSNLTPLASILDTDKIRTARSRIPILYSAIYEPGLTEFSDRIRVNSINELAMNYINS